MKDRLINGNDVIEHAEVNGESREFVQKLIDYISDAPTHEAIIKIDSEEVAKQIAGKMFEKETGDRDCKSCAYSSPFDGIGNGCTSWSCEYISRKEAIKAWKRSQWIPVEERLPETHTEQIYPAPWETSETATGEYLLSDPVLVTATSNRSDDSPIFVATYEDDLDGRTGWNDCFGGTLDKVVAWMPLPEPYKEEQA